MLMSFVADFAVMLLTRKAPNYLLLQLMSAGQCYLHGLPHVRLVGTVNCYHSVTETGDWRRIIDVSLKNQLAMILELLSLLLTLVSPFDFVAYRQRLAMLTVFC